MGRDGMKTLLCLHRHLLVTARAPGVGTIVGLVVLRGRLLGRVLLMTRLQGWVVAVLPAMATQAITGAMETITVPTSALPARLLCPFAGL